MTAEMCVQLTLALVDLINKKLDINIFIPNPSVEIGKQDKLKLY